MALEGKSTEERLMELEMQVDVIRQLPQALARGAGQCCNSCNNIASSVVAEQQLPPA